MHREIPSPRSGLPWRWNWILERWSRWSTTWQDYYSYERRGIRLLKIDDCYQLASAPEYAERVRRAMETRRPPQLSQAALESLAVIAYFQPTTKAYVEQIRGVDSSYTVGLLADRGLIEECGRLSVPGRPILYRTTQNFLRSFGLKTLDERRSCRTPPRRRPGHPWICRRPFSG